MACGRACRSRSASHPPRSSSWRASSSSPHLWLGGAPPAPSPEGEDRTRVHSFARALILLNSAVLEIGCVPSKAGCLRRCRPALCAGQAATAAGRVRGLLEVRPSGQVAAHAAGAAPHHLRRPRARARGLGRATAVPVSTCPMMTGIPSERFSECLRYGPACGPDAGLRSRFAFSGPGDMAHSHCSRKGATVGRAHSECGQMRLKPSLLLVQVPHRGG